MDMGTAEPTPDQIRQRKVDNNERHGKIDRSKSRLAQETAYENTVNRLVQCGSKHTDCSGDGSEKEQLQRRCL